MGKPRTDLSADEVRRFLEWDETAQLFRWKVNRPPRGFAGAKAGYTSKTGHYVVSVRGIVYIASRLRYLIDHGTWPTVECKICGTTFTPYKITDNLCGSDCRAKSLHDRDAERAPRER